MDHDPIPKWYKDRLARLRARTAARRLESRPAKQPKSSRYDLDYFLARIKLEPSQFITPCWIWQAAKDKLGYARIDRRAGSTKAGVALWRRLYGPTPPGTELGHICHRSSCINPAHVRPVSRSKNIAESHSPAAEVARHLYAR